MTATLNGYVIFYARLPWLGRKTRTYPSGRVCAKQECSTILSRYNAVKHCALHEPFVSLCGGPDVGRKPDVNPKVMVA